MLACIAVSLLAAPVYAYLYRAPIAITESSGTSYTGLPVIITAPVTWLVANGFTTTSTALDTRVETGAGIPVLHMMADNKILTFLPTLEANSQVNRYFTTGNTPLTSFPVIVGDGGYVTIADASGLELGNDFEIEFEGWVDTSSDGNLVNKTDAFKIYTESGDVKSWIPNSGTVTLVPDGPGDYTNIASQLPASTAHWDKVDDSPGSPDDDTTYVYTASATQEKDAYNLAYNPLLNNSTINSVTVYFRHKPTTSAYVQPFLRLGSAETAGTERYNTSGTWAIYSEVLGRPGGGSWTPSDIAALQVVVGLRTSTSRCTQIYVEVNYTGPRIVTATSVSSEGHIVRVWADGTDFGIDIDGVTEDSIALGGVSVPDNANNWVISVPYFNYYEHTALETPVVMGRSKGATSAVDTTSHSITLPSDIQAGELLLVVFSVDSDPTCTDSSGLWTKLGQTTSFTAITGAVLYKVATGGDSLTITTSVAQQSSHIAFRVSNFSGIPTATGFGGSGINFDPPLHNPGVSKPYLWIAAGSADTTVVASVAPASYSDLQTQAAAGASGASTSTAERVLFASSEDPGVFTSSTCSWVSYTISVPPATGTSLKVWYQPNTMISGTVLPDRQGTAQNGVITWGSNPVGVAATLGSLVPAESPLIGLDPDDTTRDVFDDVGVSDWFTEPDISVRLAANPIRPLVVIMSDSTTMTELQAWRLLGLALVLFVTVGVAAMVRGHLFIAGASCAGVVGILVQQTIWPMWALIFIIPAIVAGLIAERTPQV